ncbi:MAG: cytochrome P450 [Actinomycetota bacterium]|nr:cytochrome P450 [Actinomycetota bacterium]
MTGETRDRDLPRAPLRHHRLAAAARRLRWFGGGRTGTPHRAAHRRAGLLITGYDEARHALHDPRLIKTEAAQAVLSRGLVPPEVFAAMGHHMLNSNPPDHARLRRLVTAAFTRRRIQQLAPRIQQITDELLNAMTDAVQIDLIDSFAYPLPLTVICELLGVPANRRAEFRHWSSITVPECWPVRTSSSPRPPR